jgi:hypothetical protein
MRLPPLSSPVWKLPLALKVPLLTAATVTACAASVTSTANSSPDLYPYLPRRMAAVSGTAVMLALASPVATNASSTASEKHRGARLKLRSWLTAVGFLDVYVIRFNTRS